MNKIFTYILIVITTACTFDDLIRETNIYEASPLYPSISLFHENDLIRCHEQVDKILDFKTKGVNIVINQYAILQDNKVQSFCFKDKSNYCKPLNENTVQHFTESLSNCLSPLLKNNIEITILPHIDDKDAKVWRNHIEFNPEIKYQGYSYIDALITPIIEVLRESGSKVFFNLTGEMGNTLFNHAKVYNHISKEIKKSNIHFKVGVGLNFNKVNGDANPNKIQRKELQNLFNDLDFIGFSNYKAVRANKDHSQFEDAIWDFMKELKGFGIKIKKDKEIHFSEIGIGGGASKYDGHTPAKSFNEALGSPYSGIHVPYSKEVDPWQRQSVKKARHFYYYTLAKYLSQKKKYNLTRAYLWNVGSWDFMNIYPGTWGYEDKELTSYLLEYNSTLQLE